MGNGSSSTSVATAKVILHHGELREFANPVRVSDILQENHSCFIINSNDLDFNKVVSAMNEIEELQVGELYFALPLSWLNSPLRAEDMANLAIRASLALNMGSGGGEKCCFCMPCRIKIRILNDQTTFTTSNRDDDDVSSELMLNNGSSGDGYSSCDVGFVKKGKQKIGGRRGRFVTKLSVILEE
ncbi:hypothetical protein AB3S75_043288 [Citrus x aurantiifolia]